MRSKATAADTIGAAIGMAVLTLTAIGLTGLTIAMAAGPANGAAYVGAAAIGLCAVGAWAAVGSGAVAACKAGR